MFQAGTWTISNRFRNNYINTDISAGWSVVYFMIYQVLSRHISPNSTRIHGSKQSLTMTYERVYMNIMTQNNTLDFYVLRIDVR